MTEVAIEAPLSTAEDAIEAPLSITEDAIPAPSLIMLPPTLTALLMSNWAQMRAGKVRAKRVEERMMSVG